jgi:hypothetical protein
MWGKCESTVGRFMSEVRLYSSETTVNLHIRGGSRGRGFWGSPPPPWDLVHIWFIYEHIWIIYESYMTRRTSYMSHIWRGVLHIWVIYDEAYFIYESYMTRRTSYMSHIWVIYDKWKSCHKIFKNLFKKCSYYLILRPLKRIFTPTWTSSIFTRNLVVFSWLGLWVAVEVYIGTLRRSLSSVGIA